ncbi:hypothetical protein [Nitrosomonas cryotolerans]|uniref:hypothetical protein n=1 Tax=Nitrosomonas cryotolerans TaxID=44575 RepID=UPI003F74AF02
MSKPTMNKDGCTGCSNLALGLNAGVPLASNTGYGALRAVDHHLISRPLMVARQLPSFASTSSNKPQIDR